MKNLIPRNWAAVPVVFILVMLVTPLIWITSHTISDAKRQAEAELQELMSIVAVTDTLKYRAARAFLYVYTQGVSEIKVEDRGVADWKTVHDRALKQGHLARLCTK